MAAPQSCEELNRATEDADNRVIVFAERKPDCLCEHESLSPHSPGLVQDEETIVRVVCVPLHVHPKRKELKSSFFSHAFSHGLSVQRAEASSSAEVIACVERLLAGAPDRAWLGYVEAPASAIRAIHFEQESASSFCVADAALEDNRAHAEVHCSRVIPEADRIEIRAALMNAFNSKSVRGRRQLRDGEVWAGMKEDLRARSVPPQWVEIA